MVRVSRVGSRQIGVSIVAAVLLGAIPLAAKEDTPSTNPLDDLRSCSQISADAERLACFDKSATALLSAQEAGDLTVVDREDVRKTRRSLFGFSLPDIDIFGRADKAREPAGANEIEVLNTTVQSSRSTKDGIMLTTAEGAVWLIDNPPRRLLTPRPGQPVEFRKGALSSYFIEINGQRSVKGRRIQ